MLEQLQGVLMCPVIDRWMTRQDDDTTGGWHDKMMAWQVDDMTRWWHDRWMTWQDDGMTGGWHKMMAWQVDDTTRSWHDRWMVWQVDDMTGGWHDRFFPHCRTCHLLWSGYSRPLACQSHPLRYSPEKCKQNIRWQKFFFSHSTTEFTARAELIDCQEQIRLDTRRHLFSQWVSGIYLYTPAEYHLHWWHKPGDWDDKPQRQNVKLSQVFLHTTTAVVAQVNLR